MEPDIASGSGLLCITMASFLPSIFSIHLLSSRAFFRLAARFTDWTITLAAARAGSMAESTPAASSLSLLFWSMALETVYTSDFNFLIWARALRFALPSELKIKATSRLGISSAFIVSSSLISPISTSYPCSFRVSALLASFSINIRLISWSSSSFATAIPIPPLPRIA